MLTWEALADLALIERAPDAYLTESQATLMAADEEHLGDMAKMAPVPRAVPAG